MYLNCYIIMLYYFNKNIGGWSFMLKRKYPKRFYGSGLFVLKMIVVLIAYFVLIYLFADQMFRTVLTVILIPFIMTIFAEEWKNLIHPRCCFVDAFLYEYSDVLSEGRWVWQPPDQDTMRSVIRIKNIGVSTITSIRICTNPIAPKTDTWYTVLYPFKEGEELFIAMPIEKELIDTLFIMPSYEGGDTAMTLSGKKINTKRGIAFNQVEKSFKDYNANKVKQFIPLVRSWQ